MGNEVETRAQRVRNHLQRPDHSDWQLTNARISSTVYRTVPLWKSTVEVFELEEHELGMLREACRTADAIDGLQDVVDRDGVLNESSQGLRAHPALVELRQQRICFARLVAQLGLPTGDEGAAPAYRQRRGARGVYGIAGVVS